MALAIYLLCAITSTVCAWLLGRAFLERRARLLLGTSICFVGLALNNLLVLVDLIVVPDVDLSLPRAVVTFLGLLTLVFGLVWESQERNR